MAILTRAESDKINSAKTQDCATQEAFESEHSLAHAQDLGGLVVYFNDKELVAFYDYERELGAVFK